MDLKARLRTVQDFPKKGIAFIDITPLLAHGKAFQHAVDQLAVRFADCGASKILAAEARGFILGAALAYKMGLGFIPVRKHGKLPWTTTSVTYQLEYGTDTLCMHTDAIDKGERILIIDDVLATGGTMQGMIKLVETSGGVVAGIGLLIELSFLKGAEKLPGYDLNCLIRL
jgi:adenine phosphoribosyltransferase